MPQSVPQPRRQFALEVLARLHAAGFEAYWAGGCVRDQLLGAEPKDYDIATSARPEQVRELFGRRHTVAIGASFGVIMVVGRGPQGQVEVTTFRHDGIYSDGRRPDAVTFGTAEEDVQRRDFTINGMLYDPLAERVLDYVGGQHDLQAGVVRAIGDARKRFSEDKLRLLRAVRFAARFDFRLEEHTRQAVEAMAGEITVVAAERIAQEMRAMLAHVNRHKAMRLALDLRLLPVILPEVAAIAHADEWDHTLRVLERIAGVSFTLGMAALVHAIDARHAAAAKLAEHACRRWRLSNDESERIAWLVAHQQDLLLARERKWSTIQPLLIHTGAVELLALHEAIALARGEATDHVAFCREKLALPPEQLDPPPLLTGDDLLRLELPRGKLYQVILSRVRAAQLDGEVGDKDEAIRLALQLASGSA